MSGGGAGHIADMNSSLRNNRQLRKGHKRFHEDDDGFIYFDTHRELVFKTLPDSQKRRLLKRIREDIAREKKTELGLLITSILLVVLAFGWFARNLF